MDLDARLAFVWLSVFVVGVTAAWLLRNRVPFSREAVLQGELDRLRDDLDKLRTTVNVLVRERGEDQRIIERLRERVRVLESELAAATGRVAHGTPANAKLLTALRRALCERLSEDEVRTLAFDLDIEWAGLAGDSRLAKTRALLDYLDDRLQIELLVSRLRQMRPDVEIAG